VPRKYFDMFPPEDLELPTVLQDDLTDNAHALIAADPQYSTEKAFLRQKLLDMLFADL
jgi:hypothetical protein